MVHDATCSIGTELAALRSTAAFVLGSDLDPVRLAMARHNLRRCRRCAAPTRCARSPRDAVVLLDPARRSGGRRRFDPRAYTPPLDRLLEAYRGA